ELLVRRAIETGRITPEEAAELTPDGRIELAFLDGLSTAARATEVSGRGIGMSAVREAVVQRGGTIEVRTGPGGTSVRLLIPRSVPEGAAEGSGCGAVRVVE